MINSENLMDDGIKSRIVSGIRCLYKDRYLAVEP
jgi:hypothetical protein